MADLRETGSSSADVVVVGAGLAGLVATAELAEAGRRVVVLDQEPASNLGGQAHWSFGGLFLVDSPEQRRMGVRDSLELARADWLATAGFDGPDDAWPRRWAEAYLTFAAGEKRSWLRAQGVRFFPVVGWAERGDGSATGHGNTVPRFHITWGTGPGVLAPFIRRVQAAVESGRVELRFRHRVDELVVDDGRVTGVRGSVLEPADDTPRGAPTPRRVVRDFAVGAAAVLVTSGGIGGDHDLVRQAWPERLGTPPTEMISGVPAHVDGRMLGITQRAGGAVVNADRMWHYTEGIVNHAPVWPQHGIRILPGPSALWLDATGHRLPAPLFPGFDTLGTLAHLRRTGHDHSWFVLNRRIAEKEIALSGSEQNPDLTGKSVRGVLGRIRPGAPGPVHAFLDHGVDFVSADDVDTLVQRMNDVTPTALLDPAQVTAEIEARDRQVGSDLGKDAQLTAIRSARGYRGDRLIRVARPHRLTDPKAGPLIAVRLHVITRKTLGGLATDLSGQVLNDAGQPVPGLFAAGEVSGFGGGGMHGHRSLEGTFLGGCLFSGRQAGRALAVLTA